MTDEEMVGWIDHAFKDVKTAFKEPNDLDKLKALDDLRQRTIRVFEAIEAREAIASKAYTTYEIPWFK